jgi:outer membrane protein OmpA-like peptidoglycan-associated protein
MFDEEDRDLNLVLPLVLGVAVVISIATMLFVGLGMKGSGAAKVAASAPAVAVSAPAAAIAPAPPAVAVPAGFPAKVFFAVGSSALDAVGQKTIADAVAALAASPTAKIALSGFVDASGNKDQNAELAKQRAFAVRDALKAAGIAENRIDLRRPQEITAGGTQDNEARRVEITLAQ